MDEITAILFDNYISGNLSEQETQDLEKRLETDEVLAASFQTFTNLKAHLENRFSEERDTIKQTIDGVNQSYKTSDQVVKNDPKIRRLQFIKYGLAASVLLLCGLMLTLTFSEPSYEDYAFEEQISLTERSGNDTAFAKAEKAFNSKNYEGAIVNFDAILSTDDSAQIRYYKGIALTELNRFSEGDIVFKKLLEGSSAFKYKAQFYLALSLLKQDKKDASANVLSSIPESAEVFEKAQKLYSKLK